MKLTLVVIPLLAVLLAAPAPAQTPVPDKLFGVAGGVNGIWFDATGDADVEAAANVRASLSPHISLVASGARGFRARYWRYSGGVRITATDVNDKTFSIGLGYEYRGSDSAALKPDEWAGTATLGWKPWPKVFPPLVLGLYAWYGVESNTAGAAANARVAASF